MSHFTVAVFTDSDDQSIDDLLEPYDENRSVAPYLSETKEEIIANARTQLTKSYETNYQEWLKNPMKYAQNRSPGHIEYLKSLPEKLVWSNDQLYQDRVKDYEPHELSEDGSILSTYNPDSKWDWYVIGGRWQGLLILKDVTHGFRGEPGLMTEMSERFDAAFVRNIDFDAMENLQKQNLAPYENARKNSWLKPEYFDQKFPTEKEYIKRSTVFSTYAVITPDGKWHAPGNMGWFGISSENDDEGRDWDKNYYESFIRPALENNWYMTVLDCHI